MKQHKNRRTIIHDDYQLDTGMNVKELGRILKIEKREDNIKLIKELIFNKVFAKTIHLIAISLSILFVILGVLNH